MKSTTYNNYIATIVKVLQWILDVIQAKKVQQNFRYDYKRPK